jgi:hypothetical protein
MGAGPGVYGWPSYSRNSDARSAVLAAGMRLTSICAREDETASFGPARRRRLPAPSRSVSTLAIGVWIAAIKPGPRSLRGIAKDVAVGVAPIGRCQKPMLRRTEAELTAADHPAGVAFEPILFVGVPASPPRLRGVCRHRGLSQLRISQADDLAINSMPGVGGHRSSTSVRQSLLSRLLCRRDARHQRATNNAHDAPEPIFLRKRDPQNRLLY